MVNARQTYWQSLENPQYEKAVSLAESLNLDHNINDLITTKHRLWKVLSLRSRYSAVRIMMFYVLL